MTSSFDLVLKCSGIWQFVGMLQYVQLCLGYCVVQNSVISPSHKHQRQIGVGSFKSLKSKSENSVVEIF